MNLPEKYTDKKILIAGAGGGFDVFAGLPLGLQLMQDGNSIFFANYSFTALKNVCKSEWIAEGCLKINSESFLSTGDYFPESFLARWLSENGFPNSEIYCFSQLGVSNLKAAYQKIVTDLEIDCIFIVDGGCDGIFRGDEYDLGTPSMDSISIIAASLLNIPKKHYVLTALGTEGVNHEVSHAEALNRIADFIKNNKYTGSCSLVPNDPVVLRFVECMKYVYKSNPHQSNIVNSIICSVSGDFGYKTVTEKASHSPVWISPLTSIYWFIDLEAVAKMKLFYDRVLNSLTVKDVADEIERSRPIERGQRPSIPI